MDVLTFAKDIISRFEGCKLTAYQDQVGVWTIGYGHTGNVHPGDVITQEQAEELLLADLESFEQSVRKLVKVELTDNQLAALISFAFNLGGHTLQTSTLLKLLNQGDYNSAADQFLRWDHAGGVQVAGLTRRRQAERLLFLGQSGASNE